MGRGERRTPVTVRLTDESLTERSRDIDLELAFISVELAH